MNTHDDDASTPRGRTIAIVSGKGGSGKTVVAAVMAQILDAAGQSTIIVDADTGTAGMTFYFGLEMVDNTSVGVSDLFLGRKLPGGSILNAVRPIRGFEKARFLGAGDFRRFPKNIDRQDRLEGMKSLVRELSQDASFVILDCRGGLDEESLVVCECVDEVLLIVETDTTSYQATQRLVDILSENELAQKLKGFIINKVFDNPKTMANNGTAAFRCDYLTAIPFDFGVMREFFEGKVPRTTSIFGVHLQKGLRKAYPDTIPEPLGRVFSFDEYNEIGFVNLDSLRGGVVLSLFIVGLTAVFSLYWWGTFLPGGSFSIAGPGSFFRTFGPSGLYSIVGPDGTFAISGLRGSLRIPIFVGALSLLGLAASINNIRQAIGHAVSRLVSTALFVKGR